MIRLLTGMRFPRRNEPDVETILRAWAQARRQEMAAVAGPLAGDDLGPVRGADAPTALRAAVGRVSAYGVPVLAVATAIAGAVHAGLLDRPRRDFGRMEICALAALVVTVGALMEMARRRPTTLPPSVAAALERWEASDATRRLGLWIRLVGVAVVTVGLLGRSQALPASTAHAMLGLATFALGWYMRACPDPLSNAMHRRLLVAVLAGIFGLAFLVAAQFHASGSGPLVTRATKTGMALAGGLAMLAAVGGVAGVAFVHDRKLTKHGRDHERALLTQISTAACGAACAVYAMTHLTVAMTVAPTVSLQIALGVSAALLALAARESFHHPRAFLRIMYSWVRGRLPIDVPSPGREDAPEPRPVPAPGADQTTGTRRSAG